MKSLFTLSFLAVLAVPAAAVSPATAEFLTSQCGLDPNSESVRVADQDGTISTVFRGDAREFSLESLAQQRLRNGVIAFVTTRHFIKKLKANFAGTPIPREYYDAMYLTPDEKKIVGRKILESA